MTYFCHIYFAFSISELGKYVVNGHLGKCRGNVSQNNLFVGFCRVIFVSLWQFFIYFVHGQCWTQSIFGNTVYSCYCKLRLVTPRGWSRALFWASLELYQFRSHPRCHHDCCQGAKLSKLLTTHVNLFLLFFLSKYWCKHKTTWVLW